MEAIKIPRNCDEPQQFFLWSIDEVAPFLILFVFGFIVEQTLIFSVIGLYATKLFRKFKDSMPDGYFIHLLYWNGLGVQKGYSLDNPYRRHFYS